MRRGALLALLLAGSACGPRAPHISGAAAPRQIAADMSELSNDEQLVLSATLESLAALTPGALVVPEGAYRRLARFERLYGFPLDGPRLRSWLTERVRRFRRAEEWTVAVFEGDQTIVLGRSFFRAPLLERLYVLIHEARHSDPEAPQHVGCPEGFPFVSAGQPDIDLGGGGTPACDAREDGAYGFQAAFLYELHARGLIDPDRAGLLYNSTIARVLAKRDE